MAPAAGPSRSPAEHALKTLRVIFGEENVPRPKGHAISSWQSDPYARGSYSYVAVGASDKDYVALAEPLSGGRLAFAGEHCCKEYPDSVGGAMITGLRAAVTVMASLEGRDAISEWLEDEEERTPADEEEEEDDDASASESEDEEEEIRQRAEAKERDAERGRSGGVRGVARRRQAPMERKEPSEERKPGKKGEKEEAPALPWVDREYARENARKARADAPPTTAALSPTTPLSAPVSLREVDVEKG